MGNKTLISNNSKHSQVYAEAVIFTGGAELVNELLAEATNRDNIDKIKSTNAFTNSIYIFNNCNVYAFVIVRINVIDTIINYDINLINLEYYPEFIFP